VGFGFGAAVSESGRLRCRAFGKTGVLFMRIIIWRPANGLRQTRAICLCRAKLP
jgi:hypothetical protein